MPLSLNNSEEIVANRVSIFKGNKTIDLIETIDAVQGLAPETLNSLEKLATALNNDSSFLTQSPLPLATKRIRSLPIIRLLLTPYYMQR